MAPRADRGPGTHGWRGPVVRSLLVLFALAMFASAGYVAVTAPADPLAALGVVVLALVGVDAAAAALRRRAPWLARLGPLP